MLVTYPENVEESPKVKLSQKHRDELMKHLFSQMVTLQTDNGKTDRFALFGGCLTVDDVGTEILVRFIIENETQLSMVQLTYEEGYKEYAKDLMKMFIFLCNEKAML